LTSKDEPCRTPSLAAPLLRLPDRPDSAMLADVSVPGQAASAAYAPQNDAGSLTDAAKRIRAPVSTVTREKPSVPLSFN